MPSEVCGLLIFVALGTVWGLLLNLTGVTSLLVSRVLRLLPLSCRRNFGGNAPGKSSGSLSTSLSIIERPRCFSPCAKRRSKAMASPNAVSFWKSGISVPSLLSTDSYTLDYDRTRSRNSPMESSRAAAKEKLTETIQKLGEISGTVDWDAPVQLHAITPYEQNMRSSLGREVCSVTCIAPVLLTRFLALVR